MDDLILDVDFNVTKAKAKAEKLQADLQASKQKAAEIRDTIADLKDKIAQSAKEQENYNQIIDSTANKLETYRLGQTQLTDEEIKSLMRRNDEAIKGLAKQETAQKRYEKQLNSATSKLSVQNAKINQIGASIKETVNKQKVANSGWGKFKKNIDSSEKSIKRFGKRFSTLVSSALFFTLITKAFTAIRDSIGQILKKDKQLMKEWNQIRVNLMVIGMQLYETIKPALSWILGILNTITQVISYVLTAIFGKGAKSTKEMAKYMGDTADNAKKAGMATASFDTLQTASGSANDTSAEENGGLDYSSASNIKTKTDEELIKIATISGIAMLGLGLILLLTAANIPLGLFLVVAGGLTVYKTIKENYGSMPAETQRELSSIILIASGVLSAIGIILMLVGQIPLGIGLLIAGIGLFGASAVTISKSRMSEESKKELGTIMSVASWALLALGIIILLFANIPLGLGLIAVSVVTMVAAASVKNGGITEQTKAEIGAIMAVAGASLLALGIILVCVGVIPLGIALIAAGAASLVGAITLNWGAIVKKIKSIGESISKIFVSVWNGIKKGFKSMVNGIISYANLWIKGLNLLLAPIRGIIYGVAKAFGSDIKFNDIKIPTIPKLATGAVLPGGKPFMAWVNDQPKGQTNIEAPLDTIVEAFKRAGGGQPQNITITAEGSMAQFIKMLNLKIKQENDRASVW